MPNLSYENESCMQVHFLANRSHFNENGFAPKIVLKQRHKGIQKWPISSCCTSDWMEKWPARVL